ncbi:hypothetical protein CDOMC_1447 [Campylobacter sp. RM16192]|nr:hypothetical protein CDOMC_1447 [Campylobacter sp. RM16192]
MAYNKFSIFHKWILASFLLIFLLSGCGYKANPFYDTGESQESARKTDRINQF